MPTRERRLREEKRRHGRARISGSVTATHSPPKEPRLLDRVISRLDQIKEAVGNNFVAVSEFTDSVSPAPTPDTLIDHPERMGRAGSIEDRLDEIDVLLHALATQTERLASI